MMVSYGSVADERETPKIRKDREQHQAGRNKTRATDNGVRKGRRVRHKAIKKTHKEMRQGRKRMISMEERVRKHV